MKNVKIFAQTIEAEAKKQIEKMAARKQNGKLGKDVLCQFFNTL